MTFSRQQKSVSLIGLTSPGGIRRVRAVLPAVLILFLSLVVGRAELTNAPVAMPLSPGGSGILALFRVLGALALVLGVFFGGLWLARNWQRLAVRSGPAPKLAVHEVKALGQRHTLYVVGYKEQRLLIAASPTGVNLLTTLPAASLEEFEAASEPLPARPQFSSLFLQAIGHKS